MATVTSLKVNTIQNWFKNRRQFLNQATKILRFSSSNILYLKKKFEKNNKPSKSRYERMVKRTGLTLIQLKRWFFEQRKKTLNFSR